jgi:hypothetical protein
MVDSLATYLKYGTHFFGVEHALHNNQEVCRLTHLKKSKKNLKLESVKELNGIKEIQNVLPKNQHISVVFNNSQVLTKELTIPFKKEDIQASILKVFPNIDLKEFYYEILEGSDTNLISIIRRDFVEEIISKYEKNGLIVINFSLGLSCLSYVAKLIESDNIVTTTHNIQIKDGKVFKINPVSNIKTIDYKINGLRIANKYLLPFSICLDTILQIVDSGNNTYSYKNKLLNAFLSDRYFNIGIKTALGFVFVVLLVNFFVFNNYFNENRELQSLVDVNVSSKESVLQLQEEIKTKQILTENLSRNENSSSSFYINQIVALLPNSINLINLQYQPLLKKLKKDKPIHLDSNYIKISGITKNSSEFSNWVELIQEQNWVESLEVTRYSDQSKTGSEFTIELKFKK